MFPVICDDFTSVSVNIEFFFVRTTCSLSDGFRNLKMEATGLCETCIIYQSTLRHLSVHHNFRSISS